jgi:hypothetical protein
LSQKGPVGSIYVDRAYWLRGDVHTEPAGSIWRGRAAWPIYGIMTGAELRSIREAYGLSASVIAKALGYSGPKANMAVQVRRLERNARPIPPSVEKLALMYARHGIPEEWCA